MVSAFEIYAFTGLCAAQTSPHRYHLQGSTWKMGPIGCPETSVANCKSTRGKIVEDRRPPLHRGEGMKSRTSMFL